MAQTNTTTARVRPSLSAMINGDIKKSKEAKNREESSAKLKTPRKPTGVRPITNPFGLAVRNTAYALGLTIHELANLLDIKPPNLHTYVVDGTRAPLEPAKRLQDFFGSRVEGAEYIVGLSMIKNNEVLLKHLAPLEQEVITKLLQKRWDDKTLLKVIKLLGGKDV